jgi:hypothetical protein
MVPYEEPSRGGAAAQPPGRATVKYGPMNIVPPGDGEGVGENVGEGVGGVATGSATNTPHLNAEPLPIRIAIFPLRVAAINARTRTAVRLLVRAAAPALEDRIESSRVSTGPTALHVPLWRTTGRRVAGRILTSLRASDPVPVLRTCTLAVPFTPLGPIFACQALVTVTDEAAGTTASEPTSARPTSSVVQARIL